MVTKRLIYLLFVWNAAHVFLKVSFSILSPALAKAITLTLATFLALAMVQRAPCVSIYSYMYLKRFHRSAVDAESAHGRAICFRNGYYMIPTESFRTLREYSKARTDPIQQARIMITTIVGIDLAAREGR